MNALRLARWTALCGYFGLLLLLLNWHTWLSPPTDVPRAFLLIALLIPLLFPMRGLLYARAYTHAWTSFLALFYFALGIDIAFTSALDWHLGWAQVLFSMILFTGCIFFPRLSKRQ